MSATVPVMMAMRGRIGKLQRHFAPYNRADSLGICLFRPAFVSGHMKSSPPLGQAEWVKCIGPAIRG